MPTIKTYRKVGAFYIACEADFPTPIPGERPPHAQNPISDYATYRALTGHRADGPVIGLGDWQRRGVNSNRQESEDETGLEMLRTETFRGAEQDLAAALCENTLTVPSA